MWAFFCILANFALKSRFLWRCSWSSAVYCRFSFSYSSVRQFNQLKRGCGYQIFTYHLLIVLLLPNSCCCLSFWSFTLSSSDKLDVSMAGRVTVGVVAVSEAQMFVDSVIVWDTESYELCTLFLGFFRPAVAFLVELVRLVLLDDFGGRDAVEWLLVARLEGFCIVS